MPSIDATLMMRAGRFALAAARKRGRNARVVANTAVRFTVTTFEKALGENSDRGRLKFVPALLMRTSQLGPTAFSTASSSSSCETSACTDTHRPGPTAVSCEA
eukprot:scaffold4387_cov126-Isochrysis_galbana.AAC.5